MSARFRAFLAGCCALACDRGFDEVREDAGGSFDGNQYHYPLAFRGSDELGEPFPLTTCPRGQVMTGLSVTLDDAELPVAMTLLCAKIEADFLLGDATRGPTLAAEGADLARDPHLLECGRDQAVVSLRGSVFPTNAAGPLFVDAIGIECAELGSWLRDGGFPDITLQAGRTGQIGSQNFVDGCASRFAVINGFSGRLSNRIEQMCIGCWVTWW